MTNTIAILEANDNDGPAVLGMARRTMAMTDAEICTEQIAALKRQLNRANARHNALRLTRKS